MKPESRKGKKQLAQQGYTESELSDRVMLNIDFARANMKDSIYDQAVLEYVATTFPQTEAIIENYRDDSNILTFMRENYWKTF